MSPEQPEFRKLVNDVNEIKTALMGNPYDGKLGLVHNHDKIMLDLYGIDPTGRDVESKKNTLLLRLSAVEDFQKKALLIFGVIVFVLAGARLGFGAVIDFFSKKP